ncbi:catalase [Virgibacillus salexigens]|uniref:catalase n=1 Tax=Virgibacillus massiliensis TaxID=1462526 RepID=UPI00136C7A46|nr:catalase [Virgibacillus massiliensis]MYL43881.1 catalase [Virgibacillus massiliensis]
MDNFRFQFITSNGEVCKLTDKWKDNKKDEQLEIYRVNDKGKAMTTNQGLKVSEDELSLTGGVRGPTLMEDFHFREKVTHFDHERIPERVVHARGFAAHGEFQLYENMERYTKANIFTDTSKKTPVFVRFSTVNGARGSADTARDARGFATKFYTDEGNYDLVANNIPVFFIQDGIKFPDVVHSFKPEPLNDIPQASTAHDNFWDFVANNPENAHMVMWIMSDRAIPRSFRMMEGFGVNTFRFVNAEGEASFVKFHWKPVLGTHSLVWEEAQKLMGVDPDYHRNDLWNAIERGDYPEYELGVQIVEQEDEFKFDFDLLDATKLIPEEEVPVQIIGKMTLTKNVDNFFAETEQVAFHPGNVVPGIDFTNDPLLQARLFSYIDTQLIRLGGPNFHEIPINRPICPFHNNQRDGYHRMTINTGRVNYHRNSLAGNTPTPVPPEEGGYKHYEEKVEGRKIRARSKSFTDFFSQATMFWNSMSAHEKKHIIDAFSFELGKVKSKSVRQQNVDFFANVNLELARTIARNIGVAPPKSGGSSVTKTSPALSQLNTRKSAKTRKVAVILSDGFDGPSVKWILDYLKAEGLVLDIISEDLGIVKGTNGVQFEAMENVYTADPVLYDALYLVRGSSKNRRFNEKIARFLDESYRHKKTIGATEHGVEWLNVNKLTNKRGVITDGNAADFAKRFVEAVAQHRHWDR